LASWRKNGCARLPDTEIKRPPETVLERRAIIARRFVQAARTAIAFGPPILLPHEAAEWKKILFGWEENFFRERGLVMLAG